MTKHNDTNNLHIQVSGPNPLMYALDDLTTRSNSGDFSGMLLKAITLLDTITQLEDAGYTLHMRHAGGEEEPLKRGDPWFSITGDLPEAYPTTEAGF